MWFKTFDKLKHGVKAVVLLDADDENEVAEIRAMCAEWHLREQIVFKSRDAVHEFIRHCSREYIQAVIDRLVVEECNGYGGQP